MTLWIDPLVIRDKEFTWIINVDVIMDFPENPPDRNFTFINAGKMNGQAFTFKCGDIKPEPLQ